MESWIFFHSRPICHWIAVLMKASWILLYTNEIWKIARIKQILNTHVHWCVFYMQVYPIFIYSAIHCYNHWEKIILYFYPL